MLARHAALASAMGLLALLPSPSMGQAPAIPSVSLSDYYGTVRVINKDFTPFNCKSQNKPATADANEMTTSISTDLANQIAHTYFDPRVAASTTYHNVFYWATITDAQLLKNPQTRDINAAFTDDITPGKLVCTCPNPQVFSTGPQFVENV